jgi:hypothetical protein
MLWPIDHDGFFNDVYDVARMMKMLIKAGADVNETISKTFKNVSSSSIKVKK